jgi:hypothetical protein
MAPDSEVPPPPADEELLEAPAPERSRLVGSPQALAAHDALVALTKAARSFTLYDPANKVVRKLIGEYREKTRHVLDTHGPLVLEVHPYELHLGEEVVYKDADRERSLAFRLFRDGIRRVRFEQATTWDELVRLLQILSIAFTAIRQQEDDLVTLLRKAGFEHIRIAAIEGFLPEEEQTEASLAAATQRAGQERRDPPAHWDLPFPALKEAAPLRFRPVSEELLERLRHEEEARTVAPEAVRVSLDLLQLAAGTDLEAETVFALEAREFLIVEGRTDLVVELARGARPLLAGTPGAAESFLSAYLDEHTLQALVKGLSPEAELPPALGDLLEGAPGEVVGRLVDLLIEEGAGPRAPLLRRLVARSCGVSSNIVVARLHETEGASRVALMQLLAEVDTASALQAAVEATTSEEEPVQLEALRQLQAAEFTPEIARAVRHLVESSSERVRLSSLPVMAEKGKARVLPTLVAHAEKRHASLSTAEAEVTGRALATSSPRGALDTFKGWLELKGGGLLGRKTLPAPASVQRVALAGLERIGGEEADELLLRVAELGDDDVAAEADVVIDRRKGVSGG